MFGAKVTTNTRSLWLYCSLTGSCLDSLTCSFPRKQSLWCFSYHTSSHFRKLQYLCKKEEDYSLKTEKKTFDMTIKRTAYFTIFLTKKSVADWSVRLESNFNKRFLYSFLSSRNDIKQRMEKTVMKLAPMQKRRHIDDVSFRSRKTFFAVGRCSSSSYL